MNDILYGKIPILEALRAGRRKFKRFYYSAFEDPILQEILDQLRTGHVPVEVVSRDRLERKYPNLITQGCLAEVSPYPYVDLGEILSSVGDKKFATLLALDQVQDPQNLGAILRTAECVGVDGVVLLRDRATGVTAAVCKAAAGATEFLKIAQVTNLTQTIKEVQKKDFWVVGTDGESDQSVYDLNWPEKTLLVLGSEGKGIRPLVKKSCDFLISIPLRGRISSLNVSAAAAVFLYENLRVKSN